MHSSLLFVFGIALFGGLIGANFFQAIRVPQVVGYIVIGVITGVSGLGLINAETIATLKPFNFFALGIIGFLVGGELQTATFKKYARQFTGILIGEGLGAFLLVGIPTIFILHAIGCDWPVSFAGGVVFGAISSATDPASTINVLWEYRAKGLLTTSITAIVALDDALAMTLYGLGTATAQILIGGTADIAHMAQRLSIELLGAVILGAAFALLMVWLLRWYHNPEKSLSISLGLILILISLARVFEMDIILATMAMGFVLTNAAPKRSKPVFEIVRGFSGPIYVMFFVLVGASLGINNMPWWLWAIIGVYVVGRSAGKMAGAWVGAKVTGSDDVLRKYLGSSLFAQGGVAVGLSIIASEHLQDIIIADDLSLGQAIVFGVTATTLIVQLIGPPMVKWAIKQAGEMNCNITTEDVVKSLTVRDVLNETPRLSERATVNQVMDWFVVNSEDHLCPIVDDHNHLVGVITMQSLRDILQEQHTWDWMLACDLLTAESPVLTPEQPLRAAMDLLQSSGFDHMVVVGAIEKKVVGVLNNVHIRERIQRELLRWSGGFSD